MPGRLGIIEIPLGVGLQAHGKLVEVFGDLVVVVEVLDDVDFAVAIEIDQPGRLDADAAFQTVDDLRDGLFGVYDQFDLSPDIAFQSIFTDELAIGFDNGGQGLADYGFVLNAGSDASAVFWLNGYQQLNAASRLIEAAEIVEPEADEQATYNQVLGEAHALRAWGHFILLSYYSTDYADDNALSIINLDFVPTIDQQLLRMSYRSIEQVRFRVGGSLLEQAQDRLEALVGM